MDELPIDIKKLVIIQLVEIHDFRSVCAIAMLNKSWNAILIEGDKEV